MGNNTLKQWHIFQFYNIYRLFVIAVLFVFNPFTILLSVEWPLSFYFFLTCYALTICLFVYCAYVQKLSFVFLVVLSLVADLIYLNAMVFFAVTLSRGAGIFLNVSLAAFSILIPGRLALFFAALESLILLVHSSVLFYLNGVNTFFYAGIHGVGFFAVAVTALMLAQRVQRSMWDADKRKLEVLFLQRINDYIIQRLKSGVVFTDGERRISVINNKAKELFDKKEIAQQSHLSELSEELTTTLQKWEHDESLGKPHQYLLKKRNILVHVLSDPSNKKGSALIILEDVRKTVQRAQQLKLASLGEFTGSIAHELRNPLGAISHAVQLLKDSDRLSEEDRRLGEIIHSNCDRMNVLIKNILQISRREKSKIIEFSAKIFLDHFRQNTCINESVKLKIHCSPSDIKVYFDRSHLSQLLIIFIENSVRYGKNQKNEINISITTFYDSQGQVIMTISDDGRGIDKRIQDSIYDPFFTTSRQGVGLGLFIAKELCELNQALLQLDDTPKGACFKIVFREIEELQL